MSYQITICLASALVASLLQGCAGETATDTQTATESSDVDGSRFLLAAQPDGAQPVLAVRKQAKHDEEVVMVGRIGGSRDPWINGRAAFSIVDPSLKACSDIPGDKCPVPWDYCCESNVADSKALVKVVDADGKLVPVDARKLLSVQELETVVVRGKAQRDDEGNLTVLATGIYVKK